MLDFQIFRVKYSYLNLNFMYSHKLIQIIKTLNRKEMTRFREFVNASYFNKREDIQALAACLSDLFPHFDHQNCDRKELFSYVYPQDEPDQARLALLFTYTFRLSQTFLALEQCRQEEHKQAIFLLQALRAKKQYPLYEKMLETTEIQLNTTQRKDDTHYYKKYHLAAEADTYFNQIGRRQVDHSIEQKQAYLDQFFLLQKLKDACEIQVRRRIFNVDYSIQMLDAALAEVRANAATCEPLIYLYYQIYQMVTLPEHTYYFSALETLQTHQQNIATSELNYIYNYFQNYCIQQINKGEERFLSEIFKLYQAQLEQGLLLQEGYLSEWHYKNMVTTGIRLHEMTWVQDFIEQYREKLPPESQGNAYRFNLASYYYALQNYDKVLELLVKVEYSDLRYSVGAKALLLRTYYDLKEYDALLSLVQSFTLYLRRNKLMADFQRDGHYDLFKFTRRAAQIRSNLDFIPIAKSRRELKKLQEDIAHAKTIFNKSWLLEKMQELAV